MAPLELVGARHQLGRTRTSSLSSALADLSHRSERLWPPLGVDFDDFVKRGGHMKRGRVDSSTMQASLGNAAAQAPFDLVATVQ